MLYAVRGLPGHLIQCFVGTRGRLTAIAAGWGASVAALLDVFYEFLDCSPAKLVRSRGAAGVRTEPSDGGG